MTCVHIGDGAVPPNVFKLMDTNKDSKISKEEVIYPLGLDFKFGLIGFLFLLYEVVKNAFK